MELLAEPFELGTGCVMPCAPVLRGRSSVGHLAPKVRQPIRERVPFGAHGGELAPKVGFGDGSSELRELDRGGGVRPLVHDVRLRRPPTALALSGCVRPRLAGFLALCDDERVNRRG